MSFCTDNEPKKDLILQDHMCLDILHFYPKLSTKEKVAILHIIQEKVDILFSKDEECYDV